MKLVLIMFVIALCFFVGHKTLAEPEYDIRGEISIIPVSVFPATGQGIFLRP